LSDKTRYEKELADALKKLPLPSEDAAWNDMSKLLDEEHDKVPPPPLPFYRSNIFMGSVIAALLIGTLLLFICNKKSTDNTRINDQTNNSTQLNDSKSDNKAPFSNSNDQKELNNATDHPSGISNGSKNANAIPSQPTTIGTHNNIEQTTGNTQTNTNSNNTVVSSSAATIKRNNVNKNSNSIKNYQTNKKITGNTQTNTNSKNNTIVPSVTSTNTNSNNLNNNNNVESKHTNNKQINNNSPAPDKNTEADKNDASGKKISNEPIKNKTGNVNDANESDVAVVSSKNTNKNVTSTSVATTSVVDLSSKHKTNHITTAKSNGKTTANIKSATASNDDIIADDNVAITSPVISTTQSTTTTAVSKNATAVKSNSNVKHCAVIHTATALTYYEQSTAAVATSNKNNKHSYHKKGNIAASTKANTKAKISSSIVQENNTIIDTTEMIKIGQSVLANKKAKHPPVIKKDTSAINPLVAAVKDSSTKKKEKQLRIAIGVAEQQAIRLNCDCVYPNDAYTKSSLVTDYIPSVYVRIQPAKKWFVEAELKYKAPQYIQEQLYKTSVSDLPLNYTTSSYVLKKVYYNQIPISFNYYIIPHLSIGAGVIYNNFAGQTTQQDIAKKLYGTAGSSDSIISSSTISNRSNDSSVTFTKNSFQALVQSQYDWRRWSIGVRYAIGLQPYIKYKDPISGSPIEKTSNALTVFIRFELWDSKKKKKK
jgi:hypothetical protein